jgi:hypothetical protein
VFAEREECGVNDEWIIVIQNRPKDLERSLIHVVVGEEHEYFASNFGIVVNQKSRVVGTQETAARGTTRRENAFARVRTGERGDEQALTLVIRLKPGAK